MECRHLDVFHIAAAVRPLVFDPNVRELHAVLVRRQVVFVRPVLDLVARPIGSAIAV